MGAAIDTERLAETAVEAARSGGDYLQSAFRDGRITGDFLDDDVKADVDHAAEERIVEVISARFPDHAVHAEERGKHGESPYEWVIDPLDGTNNFAAGLPAFATAVAVRYRGDPIVSVIYEPLPNDLYLARRDAGATLNGEPLRTRAQKRPLSQATVSFVVGLEALRDADRRAEMEALRSRLRENCKRVVETWSPCVDWGLLASGRLKGMVCYYPVVYEHAAGTLLAQEAGVISRETETHYVGAADEETVTALWDCLSSLSGE